MLWLFTLYSVFDSLFCVWYVCFHAVCCFIFMWIHFFLLSYDGRVMSKNCSHHQPVLNLFLNFYIQATLTSIAILLFCFFIHHDVFICQVFGDEEWSFGFCEQGSGVFSCPPGRNPMYTYRERIVLGETNCSIFKVNQVLRELGQAWPGHSYDLLSKNCNHFCDSFCERLGVPKIPGNIFIFIVIWNQYIQQNLLVIYFFRLYLVHVLPRYLEFLRLFFCDQMFSPGIK